MYEKEVVNLQFLVACGKIYKNKVVYYGKSYISKTDGLYEEQVMSYREEMLKNEDSFDGCAGIENVQSFSEWIDFEGRLKEQYRDRYVPSEVFLAVRQKDHVVVGILDFRHPLSDFLFQFGGNIGYSVQYT